MKGKLLKIEPISKKFHNVFRFTRRTAEVIVGKDKSYKFVRHVFETGPAVSVLPYFYDKLKKEWCVVLVRQYRPAVGTMCLEAPGGLTQKGRNLKKEMARELLEESGIKVKPSSIKVVGKQHLAPSFCDQVVHSGVVKLDVDDAKELMHIYDSRYGVVSEREFTEVVILPISKIMKNPDLVSYALAKLQVHDLVNMLKLKSFQ